MQYWCRRSPAAEVEMEDKKKRKRSQTKYVNHYHEIMKDNSNHMVLSNGDKTT